MLHDTANTTIEKYTVHQYGPTASTSDLKHGGVAFGHILSSTPFCSTRGILWDEDVYVY